MKDTHHHVALISFILAAGVLAFAAVLLPAGTTEEGRDLPTIEYQAPVPTTSFRPRDDYDLLLLNLKPVKVEGGIGTEPDVVKKIRRQALVTSAEEAQPPLTGAEETRPLLAAAGLRPVAPPMPVAENLVLTVYDDTEEQIEELNEPLEKIGMTVDRATFDGLKGASGAEQLEVLAEFLAKQLPASVMVIPEKLEQFQKGSTAERMALLQELFNLFGVELSNAEMQKLVADYEAVAG